MLRPALLTLALLCTTACGSAGQPAPYDATGIDGLQIPTPSPDPADFVDEVDNPWLPLSSRDSWRYVIERYGEQVGTVRVRVTGPAEIGGVPTTGVLATTRVRGEGRSETTSYYAQDLAGNVWLMGQDGDGVDFRAGGAQAAGLAMPAEPRLGDAWVREDAGPQNVTVRVVEDRLGDDPDQVTLESVETGSRTTYAAGTGPVVVSLAEGEQTTELVD